MPQGVESGLTDYCARGGALGITMSIESLSWTFTVLTDI